MADGRGRARVGEHHRRVLQARGSRCCDRLAQERVGEGVGSAHIPEPANGRDHHLVAGALAHILVGVILRQRPHELKPEREILPGTRVERGAPQPVTDGDQVGQRAWPVIALAPLGSQIQIPLRFVRTVARRSARRVMLGEREIADGDPIGVELRQLLGDRVGVEHLQLDLMTLGGLLHERVLLGDRQIVAEEGVDRLEPLARAADLPDVVKHLALDRALLEGADARDRSVRDEPGEPSMPAKHLGDVAAKGLEVATLVAAGGHRPGRRHDVRGNPHVREMTAGLLELVVTVARRQLPKPEPNLGDQLVSLYRTVLHATRLRPAVPQSGGAIGPIGKSVGGAQRRSAFGTATALPRNQQPVAQSRVSGSTRRCRRPQPRRSDAGPADDRSGPCGAADRTTGVGEAEGSADLAPNHRMQEKSWGIV